MFPEGDDHLSFEEALNEARQVVINQELFRSWIVFAYSGQNDHSESYLREGLPPPEMSISDFDTWKTNMESLRESDPFDFLLKTEAWSMGRKNYLVETNELVSSVLKNLRRHFQ